MDIKAALLIFAYRKRFRVENFIFLTCQFIVRSRFRVKNKLLFAKLKTANYNSNLIE